MHSKEPADVTCENHQPTLPFTEAQLKCLLLQEASSPSFHHPGMCHSTSINRSTYYIPGIVPGHKAAKPNNVCSLPSEDPISGDK